MKYLRHLCIALALCNSLPATAVEWDTPQEPFQLYGNSYYVGTGGISAVLITSPQGHILIDASTAEGSKVIAENIHTLGFKLEDVKFILNSHVHHDHAGGIANLQKLTGATVMSSVANAKVLKSGQQDPADPQYGTLTNLAPSDKVVGLADLGLVKLGKLQVQAHYTPGHTAGGTSWTWQSCEVHNATKTCRNMVFGDSLTSIGPKTFRFRDHPHVIADFQHSFGVMETLPCDVLVTAHPEFNDVLEHHALQAEQGTTIFFDPAACRDLVAGARRFLAKRLASEAN